MRKLVINHRANPRAVLDRILERWPHLKGEPIPDTDEFEKPKIVLEHDRSKIIVTLLDDSLSDSDIIEEVTRFDETEESEGDRQEREKAEALERLKRLGRGNPLVRDLLLVTKGIRVDE